MKLLFQDGKIHAPHAFMDTTLCGMAYEGNPVKGSGINTVYKFEPVKSTNRRRITCRQCADIIHHCRLITKNELP